MALVSPTIRGKFGSTEYYLTRMKAREFVQAVRSAQDLDEWVDMDIEERMQREVDKKRVREEIAPYIACSEDRFFGAVIVLIYDGQVYFESLVEDLKQELPRAYMVQSEDLGFLTVEGGELIVLDGQHRMEGIRQVLEHEVEGPYVSEVHNDDVSVIFIPHESSLKTRRIFNKINRHAKPTNTSVNLITSEDDGNAIVSRMLLRPGAPFGIRTGKKPTDLIVNWKNTSLTQRSKKLTTLSALHEITKIVLEREGITRFDEKHRINRPTDDEIEQAYEVIEQCWKIVLENLEPFKVALDNISEIPKMRIDSAPFSLLFKPAGQVAYFKGLNRAIKLGLAPEDAVKLSNNIKWSMRENHWKDIIIRPSGTIDTRSEAVSRAGSLISYLLASEYMDKKEIENIKRQFNIARGYDYDEPREHAEEELPTPVTEM